MAPWRVRTWAQVLLPQTPRPRPPAHPPIPCSPSRTACDLGLLRRACPAAQGVLPGTQRGCASVPGSLASPALPGQTLAAPPEEEDKDQEEEAAGGTAAQPARRRTSPSGARLWPLLVPRLSESLLFSYPFRILNRPKSKSILTQTRPRVPVPGFDWRAQERSMLVAPAGRRGWRRQRPPPHEHCGAP